MSENDRSRPATWIDPDTGQVWILPRRFVPDHFKRIEDTRKDDE